MKPDKDAQGFARSDAKEIKAIRRVASTGGPVGDASLVNAAEHLGRDHMGKRKDMKCAGR